ncbi:hypothetical protein [Algihabitans albus]|uniref:hypothetical protein n=1 Tax=Algihabitans albus TaxID=2164067 RepID=UPI001ABCDA09|nr:hypothetical protein [Algihabitans albus]
MQMKGAATIGLVGLLTAGCTGGGETSALVFDTAATTMPDRSAVSQTAAETVTAARPLNPAPVLSDGNELPHGEKQQSTQPVTLHDPAAAAPAHSQSTTGLASHKPAITQIPELAKAADDEQAWERPPLIDSRLTEAQLTQADMSDSAPGQDTTDNLGEIAQKANNPISDAWLLITQNDTTLIGGDAIDGTEVANVTKFQPVISAPVLDGDWNFVVRPVLQLSSLPFDSDVGDLLGASPNDIVADDSLSQIAANPLGRTTGLGDTVLLTLLGPNTSDGWIYAGGATQIFPTASDDILGQGKWQAGPAVLLARLGNDYGGFGIEHFNIGVLPQHWWSYAGDDDRDSTNQSDIQYFINWKATPTQLIGMTPNISINWNADGGFNDKVALPVGLGFIGLFRIGKLPIRWGVEGQYYLTGPDELRRDANFRFFIAPIVPNLFK